MIFTYINFKIKNIETERFSEKWDNIIEKTYRDFKRKNTSRGKFKQFSFLN